MDITAKNYVFLCDDPSFGQQFYAQLPLTTILKQLGGTTVWTDSDRIEISIDNMKFIFDYDDWELVSSTNDSKNFLAPMPGLMFGLNAEIIENEILIDSNVVEPFFKKIGVRIRIDLETKTVYIDND